MTMQQLDRQALRAMRLCGIEIGDAVRWTQDPSIKGVVTELEPSGQGFIWVTFESNGQQVCKPNMEIEWDCD